MKTLILFAVAVIFCGGFALPETPAEREVREKAEASWRLSVSTAFDLAGLRVFAEAQIKALTVVEGVDLRKSKLEKDWRFGGLGVFCGDWELLWKDRADEFRLTWTYATKKKTDDVYADSVIVIYGRKRSKSSFEYVRTERKDFESVAISP